MKRADRAMKVKLLGGALGAEITEIDLTGNVEHSTYQSCLLYTSPSPRD